jgi:hypothetical protein
MNQQQLFTAQLHWHSQTIIKIYYFDQSMKHRPLSTHRIKPLRGVSVAAAKHPTLSNPQRKKPAFAGFLLCCVMASRSSRH